LKARVELRNWLETHGVRQVDLAERLAVSKVRVHRLLAGIGGLPRDRLEALQRETGIRGLADRLEAESPRAKRGAGVGPVPSAPPAPLPSAEPAEFDPAVIAQAMGEPGAAPILAILVKLAATDRSGSVRRAAADSLLDRWCGKAIAKTLDVTPRPPVVDEELLAKLEQRAAPEPGKLELVPPVVTDTVPRAS
jgi:hypothetical protein